MKTLSDVISTVWFGKALQVVNFGTCYGITDGPIILSSGFVCKRDAIRRAIELQDEFEL